MPTILDHTQDLNGQETHRLTSLYPAPDFVKTASHERLHGDPEKLSSHLYADSRSRLYPCHTAAATWLSTLFFADKQAAYKPAEAKVIQARLEKQAAYFQILPQCKALLEKVAADAIDDQARLPDSDFALVWTSDAGKERNYPLRNAAEVKTAAAWFSKYRDEFVFADRSRIAQKLLEKAAQHAVDIRDHVDMLNKTAGYGYCPSDELAATLHARALLVARSHPSHSQEMRKLAGIVAEKGIGLDNDMLHKVASVLDAFDRQTHLNRLYDQELDRPEDAIFKINEKIANDFVDQHFQLVSGTVYEKAAFDQLTYDHLQQWMGKNFAEEVSAGGLLVDAEKLADVAATLPRADAELFDKMARAAGIRVFARDKAAWDQGLSRADLAELAANYNPQPVSASILD